MSCLLCFAFGAILAGSSTVVPPTPDGIPWRCLALFERDRTQYPDCRKPSISAAIRSQLWDYACDGGWGPERRACMDREVARHMAWEMDALQAVLDAAREKVSK